MFLAQELPDVLDGVQLGRIGRQSEQSEIAWDPQLFASLVQSGSIAEKIFDKLRRRDCLASPGS